MPGSPGGVPPGSENLQAAADAFGTVGELPDPIDDLVEEDHIHRLEPILEIEQQPANGDLLVVGLLLENVQLADHVEHHVGSMAAEARLEQILELLEGLACLSDAGDRRLHVVAHGLGQLGGHLHAAPQHDAGDVAHLVGDLVLYGDQIEQIGAGNRQEHGVGQVEPQLGLEAVGLVLQLGDGLANLGGLFPIARERGLEERQQLVGTLVGLADMSQKRLERRAAEHCRKRVGFDHDVGCACEMAAPV